MEEFLVEVSLIESIAGSDLSALAADLGEVGLDRILDDGLARDVPVIGTFMKMYSVVSTIQNRLFARKLLRFLVGLADVPIEQRRTQLAKLACDAKERKNVGENLLLLLERMNNVAKPTMLAHAFKAYLKEQIDLGQFRALAYAVDAINMAAIPTLRSLFEDPYPFDIMEPNVHCQHLAMCGLLSIRFEQINIARSLMDEDELPIVNMKSTGSLRRNELGKLFYEVILNPGGRS